jgi:Na+-driven multidrug efflux pump
MRHFKFKTNYQRNNRVEFCDFFTTRVVSIWPSILNHTLYTYGGEHSVAIYGIISNVDVCFVSILGITQGFLPIAGFNYGGKLFKSERKCTAFN